MSLWLLKFHSPRDSSQPFIFYIVLSSSELFYNKNIGISYSISNSGFCLIYSYYKNQVYNLLLDSMPNNFSWLLDNPSILIGSYWGIYYIYPNISSSTGPTLLSNLERGYFAFWYYITFCLPSSVTTSSDR